MAFYDAISPLRAHLAANWSTAPVIHSNKEGVPPAGVSEWVLFEVLPEGTDASVYGSSGKRVKRDYGRVWCHVFVAAGTDVTTAFSYAKTLGALFEMRDISPARMFEASPAGGGQGDDDGKWFRVSVSIPFLVAYTA